MGSDGLTRTDITGCRGGVGKGSGMILPVGCLYGSHCTLREMVVGVRGVGQNGKPSPSGPWISWIQRKADQIFHWEWLSCCCLYAAVRLRASLRLSQTHPEIWPILCGSMGNAAKPKQMLLLRKQKERNNNALMDFGAFSHLKAFYGTYMVYF